MKLWQYDGLAEGISNAQSQERITPDKWQPASNIPLSNWRAASVAAIAAIALAPTLAFTNLGQPEQSKVFSSSPVVLSVPYVVQYPALSKPVFVPVVTETVTLDKWYKPTEKPVPGRPPVLHVLPATPPQDPTSMRAVQVWVDKLQTTNQFLPFPDIKRQQYSYLVSAQDASAQTQHERITADKWQPETNRPLFDFKRQQFSFPSSFFNPNPLPLAIFVTPDLWHKQDVQVLVPPKSLPHLYPSFTTDAASLTQREQSKTFSSNDVVLVSRYTVQYQANARPPVFASAEVVTLGKWFVRPQDPTRLADNRNYITAGDLQLTAAQRIERVTSDRWQPATNLPVFDRIRLAHLFPTFSSSVLPIEQVAELQDSGIRQTLTPLFRAPQNQYLFPSLTTDSRSLANAERTTPDKWQPNPNVPLFDTKRAQYSYLVAVQDASALTARERSTPDKWQPEPNRPVFDVKRQQANYPTFFFSPFPLPTVITFNLWHQQQQQILTPAKFSAHLQQAFAINPAALTQRERSSLDKWHSATIQPYTPVKLLPHLQSTSAVVRVTQAEVIAADKWQSAATQPTPDRPKTQYLYQVWTIDGRQLAQHEAVTVDEWFVELQRPIFDLKRWQTTYPSFFVDTHRFVSPWRLVARDSDGNYSDVVRSSDADYTSVSRSTNDNYNQVTRSSNDNYNQVSRAADDDWHQVDRSL